MKSVFDYLDYRDILKDAFEEKKADTPFFSYRMMAEITGLTTSNVFRVLNGEIHLPARCQSRAVEFLGLTGRAAEYFLLLISYARERRVKSRREILEKAMSLRDVARRELGDRELAYLRDWWVVAIRSLLEVTDGRAIPADLSKRLNPAVSEKNIAAALDLLKELGLVKKASSGRLLLADPHLTAAGTERKGAAVRHLQAQILGLATEALERYPRDERDISTLTFAVDGHAFRMVREIIRECRRQIQKQVEEVKRPDRVMELAVAFFPVAPASESA